MSSDSGEGTQVASSQPSESRRPVYRVESTGNFWHDAREAFKRISIADDFQRLGEMPCARNSLMSGIASGVGVGVIRIMSAGFLVGSHWAVGTFMVVSLARGLSAREILKQSDVSSKRLLKRCQIASSSRKTKR